MWRLIGLRWMAEATATFAHRTPIKSSSAYRSKITSCFIRASISRFVAASTPSSFGASCADKRLSRSRLRNWRRTAAMTGLSRCSLIKTAKSREPGRYGCWRGSGFLACPTMPTRMLVGAPSRRPDARTWPNLDDAEIQSVSELISFQFFPLLASANLLLLAG